MEDTDARPRSGVPPSHIVIALFIAATAGFSLWFWLGKRTADSASAELSFNATLAQHADPGLSAAGRPAIALADTILNDQAIAELAKQAGGPSTAASGVGEFRSSLELTQPSPAVLRVQFAGSDPNQSAANANAVALALTAWTPQQAGAPAGAADAQPAAQPNADAQTAAQPAAPVAKTAGKEQSPQSQSSSAAGPTDHGLSDALGEMGAQLTATDRELEQLAGEDYSRRSPSSNPQAAYTEYNQERLLRTRVGEAEKKLDDLRAKYGEKDAGPEVKNRLASVQQALDAILEHAAGGFGAAGTSIGQLRRERAGLSHAISVVDEERKAIEQRESAGAAQEGSAQTPSQPAPASSASQTAPAAASTAQPAQATSSAGQTPPSSLDSESSTPQQPAVHPLSLVRLAKPTPPAPLWPPVLAGFVCGLLYLGGASLAYRQTADVEDYYDEDPEEEVASPYRFITPVMPVERAGERTAEQASEQQAEAANAPPRETAPADVPAAATEAAEAETTRDEREPFAYFSGPKRSATPRRAAFLWEDSDEDSARAKEAPRRETSPPEPRDEARGKPDAFTDRLKKVLSETEVGRKFEEADQDAAGASATRNSNDGEI